MKCMNCQTEIPPQFRGAIMTNQCPGCSQNIYNDSVRELFTELAQAMEEMPNDPQGLAGWLLSNYQLIKIGTGEPVQEFYGTSKKRTKSQKDTNINDFFERAGIKPTKFKKKSAKNVAAAILADVNENMYGSEDEEEEDSTYEEEYEQEYEENYEDFDINSKKNNTLVDPKAGKPLNYYEQEELVNAFENNKVDILEMERLARLERQQNSSGGFRRK